MEAARKAAGGGAFVLGDVGPTGRFMEPLGLDPRAAFVEVYSEQCQALAEAGADAIILETFTSLDETLAALEAGVATGIPVIASMTYAKDAAGTFHTIMGDGIADSVKALDAAGAAVIAANCGLGAQELCRHRRGNDRGRPRNPSWSSRTPACRSSSATRPSFP